MLTKNDFKKLKEIFATKDDINSIRNDLKKYATKDDLKRFATKDDLKRFATKDDLKGFVTKDDLKRFATKDDLRKFSTKKDIMNLSDQIAKDVLGLIGDLSEKIDKTLSKYDDQQGEINDHERRIEKIEEKVYATSL